jgi:hypothetical protein
MKSQNLLAFGTDAKTVKGEAEGVMTGILYLLPDDKLCPMAANAGCREGCLVSAGRGAFNSVKQGRKRKTDLFYADPVAFVDYLAHEIRLAIKRADKAGMALAIRLNGTSDIPFENYKGSNGLSLMDIFPTVQFYDYTKLPTRKVPANYHLTVSYSGANVKYAEKVQKTAHNIAVVFRDRDSIPTHYLGRRVINGDKTDLRFTDDSGIVVALYAKGAAKKDRSGFVVDVPQNTLAIA